MSCITGVEKECPFTAVSKNHFYFCVLSFYNLSLYLFCCTHTLLCSVYLFYFFMRCSFETRKVISEYHCSHTQTLCGFPYNIILPWSKMKHFFPRPCGHLLFTYLGLDSVEPSEPENLSASKFSLCMINFFNIFIEFFFRDLLLLREPPCLL